MFGKLGIKVPQNLQGTKWDMITCWGAGERLSELVGGSDGWAFGRCDEEFGRGRWAGAVRGLLTPLLNYYSA
jgi:hypothetical protein